MQLLVLWYLIVRCRLVLSFQGVATVTLQMGLVDGQVEDMHSENGDRVISHLFIGPTCMDSAQPIGAPLDLSSSSATHIFF